MAIRVTWEIDVEPEDLKLPPAASLDDVARAAARHVQEEYMDMVGMPEWTFLVQLNPQARQVEVDLATHEVRHV